MLTFGGIYVHQSTAFQYLWGASLWYGQIDASPDMRWYEVGYYRGSVRHPGMVMAAQHQQTVHLSEPFAAPSVPLADLGRLDSHGYCNIAYGPYAIDAENEPDFQHRMMCLIALAAEGNLKRPDLPFTTWPFPLS